MRPTSSPFIQLSLLTLPRHLQNGYRAHIHDYDDDYGDDGDGGIDRIAGDDNDDDGDDNTRTIMMMMMMMMVMC